MNLTPDEVKRLFKYDPDTGIVTRRADAGNGCRVGDVVGNTKWDGYARTKIDGKSYLLHRIIYLYMTGAMPVEHIDHINHESSDNRWCNLRSVSPTMNHRNRALAPNNTSGVTGVGWHKGTCKWKASITTGGKKKHLALFEDWFEAVCCRKSAENKHGFHENHGSTSCL